MKKIEKYGLSWPENCDALQIEFYMIRNGGQWTDKNGTFGNGLFFHYKEAQKLLWPKDDHHRWSDLILKTILEERISVVQGAKDSGKTHVALAKFGLTDYFCFPEETLILMSSTDLRGLELRVWGEVKDMLESAREIFRYLPGNVVDSKHGVFTDSIDEDGTVRDMRKGILCIPCIGGQGEWVGIQKYVGIKQKRRRLLGDELQFMHLNYLNTLANLDKGDFKGVFVGNPIGGNGMALDKVAEPITGWNSLGEITKTTTWKNKYGGVTINLVGIDSPNFDPDRPKKYTYMVDQEDVERIARINGRDSIEFWSQIMGVRKTGIDMHKVLTVEMCERAGAFNDAIWSGEDTVQVLGIDAGFGGDPCKAIGIEFGKDVNGQNIINFNPPILVPVSVESKETVEDQIAGFCKSLCDASGIPYKNVFFEAGMWATLAVSFSRILSPQVNAVNFGGSATDRPVSNDMYIFDDKTQQRRLKKCSEHYSKLVTEFWFSVRAVVMSGQARGFPKEVAEEFSMREWYFVSGNRYELETKDECKKRMGKSPNDADAAAVAVEGARRLGFLIERLPDKPVQEQEDRWLEKAFSSHRKFIKSHELNYM